ncbi:riboflavin biosynthesis protein RibF [Candidatus Eisenbacteria bacterium]|uniref:Riboflavin biosynthesis protein n=1 Tax=Eiseniibacteriota bacterium TaxID=2212470 RepID=A0ABV6YMF0_UNCEI
MSDSIAAPGDRAVVTIGVFDGVHLGHQALIERTRKAASRDGAVATVVTFDPPPVALFAPPREPFQITPRREKTALMAELGIERALILPFTERLAAKQAREFLETVLLSELKLTGVIVGHDFSFGADREGDARLLESLGSELGFWVEIEPPVERAGARISSTRIRQHLRRGEVLLASELLGRRFTVEGQVVPGQGMGGRLLVPTANLEVEVDQMLPAPGVYIVEATTTATGGSFAGVANVGLAPTVGAGSERLVEVHLLGYHGDLVGENLRVAFADWLREAKRFPDLTSLRRAIEDDIQVAKRRFAGGLQNRLVSHTAM